MSKKLQIPLVAEVRAVLSQEKTAIENICWRPVINRQTNCFEFQTPLQIEEEIVEDLRYMCVVKKGGIQKIGQAEIPKPDLYSSTVLMKNSRIWAVDAGKDHKNKPRFSGANYPLAGQHITSKAHLHVWHERGYGYAEPLDLNPYTVKNLFEVTSNSAKIKFSGEISDPLFGTQDEFDF